MVSIRGFLAAATVTAVTFAQTTKIAFTSIPAVAEAGSSYNITWGGGDGTAVTLTLRKGNPQDLSTVGIIADAINADYYLWTVSSNYPAASDYALQIVQGQDDINYSGLFSITGGSNSSSATTSSSSGNSTMSMTSMASASGTGTAMSRNSTFSTASLTGSSTRTGTASSQSSGSIQTSPIASATSVTSANDAPIRSGSSAALILGIVAAVMLN